MGYTTGEKAEDFIGQTFNNGKLKVVGIEGIRSNVMLFRVTCSICSPDTELYPKGYFTISKSHLKNGRLPCGCSSSPKYEKDQVLLLSKRASEGRNFTVNGFAEEFKGSKTKLNCKCDIDGHEWRPSAKSIYQRRTGCPMCAGNLKPTEQEAFEKGKAVCDEIGYKALGFPNGYTTWQSKFEYECPIHGVQKVSIGAFTKKKNGTRCPCCYEDRRKELSPGFYGWFPERVTEKDYLYVINFNDGEYLKVGRTFNMAGRLRGLKFESKNTKFEILSVFTDKHGVIFSTEQYLHEELVNRGFEFKHPFWNTNELFSYDSLYILNKLLEKSELEVVDYK